MPAVVVIPVKSFAMGKQRLAGYLDPETRAQLGQALAEHVASTVVVAGLMPLIVTADPLVAEWASSAGFPSLADEGKGLNAAAAIGAHWARENENPWIVLHSDLPLLTPADLLVLSSSAENGRASIAPSSDGGTSAISASQIVSFAFGVSSFHHHLRMLGDPGVVTRTGFLLDIDSPHDLAAACASPRGAWLRDLLGGSVAVEPGHNLY